MWQMPLACLARAAITQQDAQEVATGFQEPHPELKGD
jgi:hypothetical protein